MWQYVYLEKPAAFHSNISICGRRTSLKDTVYISDGLEEGFLKHKRHCSLKPWIYVPVQDLHFQVHTHLHTCPGVCWRTWLFLFLYLTKMLRGKPPVPDTLSQSQIGGEASSSRLNYTGETRNSSSAGAAWTRRKNTPMWVATEQSTRLVLAKSLERN